MNWKIIFQLSVFGLIMAIATVWLIPEKVEPIFWLFIFIFSAYIIAKAVGRRYFLHGFCVSLVNCIWIGSTYHFLQYLYNQSSQRCQNVFRVPAFAKSPTPRHVDYGAVVRCRLWLGIRPFLFCSVIYS